MLDARDMIPTTPKKRSTLLRTSMMTPAERSQGRFMRSPDGHDAGGGEPAPAPVDAAPAAGDPPAGDPAPADASAPADDDGTALGGAGDPPAGEKEGGEGDGDGDHKPAETVGAPEAYELTAPEGMTLDSDVVALAEPVFRDLNLSNEAAQKLTEVYAQALPKVVERIRADDASQIAAARTAWVAEAKADPEVGGPNWDASIEASARALDRLGAPTGSPFRDLLNTSGLGNHVEMIRMFAKIGKSIGEDADFIAANPNPVAKKDSAEILYPNNVKGA